MVTAAPATTLDTVDVAARTPQTPQPYPELGLKDDEYARIRHILGPRRVVPGVVAGVGGYGNCLGLPNIGGEVVFDPVYQGNPLVNALCVGAMKHDEIHLANARGEGNLVVLFGARTGGDGIGGVSVLASETFDEDPDRKGPTKRPAVQVGDPFAEKV